MEQCSLDEQRKTFQIGKIAIYERLDRTKNLLIDIDPVRINEVFRNILHNAFEAVSVDTGIVEIESRIDNLMVSVLIKDNGVGIARKDLKLVASPFFTTKVKGTGLGLSVCKQVIMLHSGSMTIKSSKKTGTMVTVKLPIKKL